jgi:hypothetical protein
MKHSDDQTLFAWHFGYEVTEDGICGPLATTPSNFRHSKDMLPIPDMGTSTPYSTTNKGLRIELPIVQQRGLHALAVLQCSTTALFPNRVALPIVRTTQQDSNQYARDRMHFGPLDFVKPTFVAKAIPKTVFMKQDSEQDAEWWRATLIARIQPGGKPFYYPMFIDFIYPLNAICKTVKTGSYI